MATYLMFGTSTQETRKAAGDKRTDDAIALINKHGGEFKAGYALLGEEALLRSRGVQVAVLQEAGRVELMRNFIANNPSLWNEDIGVV